MYRFNPTAASQLQGIMVIFTVAILLALSTQVLAAHQVFGQARVPGYQGIVREPLKERSRWAELGYMHTMKREGIETMDYGRGKAFGRRQQPTSPPTPASTTFPPVVPTQNATVKHKRSEPGSDEITWVPHQRLNVDDIMQPIETIRPIPHAQWVKNPFTPKVLNQSAPIGTNKFWSNMASMSQGLNVFTQPYVYRWDSGQGVVPMWGMTINQPGQYRNTFAYTKHSDALAAAGVNKDPNDPTKWGNGYPVDEENDSKHYGTPSMLQAFHMSAREFDPEESSFFLKETTHMSALAVLSANTNTTGTVRFPLCQGAGYVTALYDELTPIFESEDSLLELDKVSLVGQELGDFENPIEKWQLNFGRSGIWWLYMIPTIPDEGMPWSEPSYDYVELAMVPINTLTGTRNRAVAKGRFHGIVQAVHVYGGRPQGFQFHHDEHAGRFCTGATVHGKIVEDVGYYGIVWKSDGLRDKELMMYALPHHMKTMDMRGVETGHYMRSTTKGTMTAVMGDTWRLQEPELPLKVGIYPWTEDEGRPNFSDQAFDKIKAALEYEAKQDFAGSVADNGSNDKSIYWTGKNMGKRATQCIAAAGAYGEKSAEAMDCMTNLRNAFGRLTSGSRIFPLAYDQTWGGIVNTFGYQNIDNDYGNLVYNDHHFHYGYLVYAAAVLARLDPGWITPKNRNFVNSLIRDYNNPSQADPFFPVFRNFDWFNGHSWAHGILEQPDGRDQESFSEDTMASFAIKLWGEYSNQPEMLGRGALMLAIQKRVIDMYVTIRKQPRYKDDIHPQQYRHNLLASIVFDGKMDTTTFFGHSREYIHGIHMIPITSITRYIRDPFYAKEEWDTFFSHQGVWKHFSLDWYGSIMLGKAVYDPRSPWDWFMSGWNPADQKPLRTHIDTGASLGWYLLVLASWGGDPGEDGFWDKSFVNKTQPFDRMLCPTKEIPLVSIPGNINYPYYSKELLEAHYRETGGKDDIKKPDYYMLPSWKLVSGSNSTGINIEQLNEALEKVLASNSTESNGTTLRLAVLEKAAE